MGKCFPIADLFKWVKNSNAFHCFWSYNLKLIVPMRPPGFLSTFSTFESLWYFWTVQFDSSSSTVAQKTDHYLLRRSESDLLLLEGPSTFARQLTINIHPFEPDLEIVLAKHCLV